MVALAICNTVRAKVRLAQRGKNTNGDNPAPEPGRHLSNFSQLGNDLPLSGSKRALVDLVGREIEFQVVAIEFQGQLFIVRCEDNDEFRKNVQPKLKSWLGQVRKGSGSEYLVLYIPLGKQRALMSSQVNVDWYNNMRKRLAKEREPDGGELGDRALIIDMDMLPAEAHSKKGHVTKSVRELTELLCKRALQAFEDRYLSLNEDVLPVACGD